MKKAITLVAIASLTVTSHAASSVSVTIAEDGINNLDEFVLGRDPTVKSPGNPLSIATDSSQLSFTLPEASGVGYTELTRKYILESSSTLDDDWVTEQQGTADGNTVTFPISGVGTRKFYRLRVELE